MKTTTNAADFVLAPNTPVSLHNAAVLNIDHTMTHVAELRKEAHENFVRFEQAGRDAVIVLMGKVYRIWHGAKIAGASFFNSFIANLKQELENFDANNKLRDNTPEEAVFIRYVFANASHKQVHVYGRALRVAYTKSVDADGFEALVRTTKDGFEGLREEAAGTKSKDTRSTVSVAFSSCRNQPTLKKMEIEWNDTEQYKVLIAVRSANGFGEVKDALLDEDKSRAVLLQFQAARKAQQANLKPKSLSKAEKDLIGRLNAQIEQENAKETQINLERYAAEQAGDAQRVQRLVIRAEIVSAMRSALQEHVNSLTAKVVVKA
ncbi:hypothetical protein [Acidovorax delafieldii]|uniref:hypothetical protein n=1 Tax=Acidovorax delafieldii TaxID=47920 RepID=UPI003ED054B7